MLSGCIAAVVGGLQLAAAAGPETDLSEILAPPPSSDWSDVSDSSGPTISGPFDSRRYAEWLAVSASDVAAFQADFDGHGFVRGYARSWAALSKSPPQMGYSRRNYLVETVEEYTSEIGANWRFGGVKSGLTASNQNYVREIATSIPNAIGAVIFGGSNFLVMFAKGNDLYIVRMITNSDDLSQAVVKQAELQYSVAPANTTPPQNGPSPGPLSSPVAARAVNPSDFIGPGLVLFMAVMGLVIVLALRREGSD